MSYPCTKGSLGLFPIPDERDDVEATPGARERRYIDPRRVRNAYVYGNFEGEARDHDDAEAEMLREDRRTTVDDSEWSKQFSPSMFAASHPYLSVRPLPRQDETRVSHSNESPDAATHLRNKRGSLERPRGTLHWKAFTCHRRISESK